MTHDSACEFLKAKTSVAWRDWLKIHNKCLKFGPGYEWNEAAGECYDPNAAFMNIIIGVAGGAGGLVLIATIFFFWYRREQAKKTNPLIGVNVKKELQSIFDSVVDIDHGEVASYIPELAKANPQKFGIAICTVNGKIHGVGDTDHKFTIQSASKPFLYAQLLTEHDESFVKSKINVVQQQRPRFRNDDIDRCA
jgi:hypothetical protein